MEDEMINKKYLNGVIWLLLILLLGMSFLINVTHYFNTKEIDVASSRCYEKGGSVILKIYNNLTSEYYFTCKEK